MDGDFDGLARLLPEDGSADDFLSALRELRGRQGVGAFSYGIDGIYCPDEGDVGVDCYFSVDTKDGAVTFGGSIHGYVTAADDYRLTVVYMEEYSPSATNGNGGEAVAAAPQETDPPKAKPAERPRIVADQRQYEGKEDKYRNATKFMYGQMEGARQWAKSAKDSHTGGAGSYIEAFLSAERACTFAYEMVTLLDDKSNRASYMSCVADALDYANTALKAISVDYLYDEQDYADFYQRVVDFAAIVPVEILDLLKGRYFYDTDYAQWFQD